ncbi:MAG: fatty acid desaturase [Elusimicrobiota bacterium]|nr:fatty acid desaturase [Elusimicrobiota bacterium]
MANATAAAPSDLPALNAVLAPYKEPDLGRSVWQLASTGALFVADWGLMLLAQKSGHYWLTLLLAMPAAGLLMRLFIVQHDCGHGSFFKQNWANDLVGRVIGVVTLTPYHFWKQTHALHHSTSGNLDRRGWGDINTLTVREYKALDESGRRNYRIYRSFPVMFIVGPVFHFLFYHRWPGIVPADWRRERESILYTNLAAAGVLLLAHWTIGVGSLLAVQLPIIVMTTWAGVWFFYVQHQYEETYWRSEKDWDYARACLEGSSYYDLPRILQWFTGNIGFHHIHHLNSRVPNYNLERAMRDNPVFQRAHRLTLRSSLRCAKLALWDEDRKRLVTFAEAGI